MLSSYSSSISSCFSCMSTRILNISLSCVSSSFTVILFWWEYMRSSISLEFLIVLATSFAHLFSKTAGRYCLPLSVILRFLLPSNCWSTSAALLWWSNTFGSRTYLSLFWRKTPPLFDFTSGFKFWLTLISSIWSLLWLPWLSLILKFSILIWVLRSSLCVPSSTTAISDWLVSLLMASFIHQMIVSPYTTYVTVYLRGLDTKRIYLIYDTLQ